MKGRFLILGIVFVLGIGTCRARLISFNQSGLEDLKRRLCLAEKDLTQAQTHVVQIKEAIAQKEIQEIQKQIQKIKEQKKLYSLQSREHLLDLFHDQRETLSVIIHNHPRCAIEAQAALDEILTLTTQISEEVIE
ncbi:MAG: hypothetical protein R3E91_01720 [Chlamydiales bacterium]